MVKVECSNACAVNNRLVCMWRTDLTQTCELTIAMAAGGTAHGSDFANRYLRATVVL